MINLGDKVKCKVTGLIGVATQRVENINGCVQYTVSPPVDKDGKLPDRYCIDEQSLDVIGAKPVAIEKAKTGGPVTSPAKSI